MRSATRQKNPVIWPSFTYWLSHFKVQFGITYLRIHGRDEKAFIEDDLILANISKVDPKETEYRHKIHWDEEEEFHLLFEFESNRQVEIGAEFAKMVAIMTEE